jgi:hypothetical protein
MLCSTHRGYSHGPNRIQDFASDQIVAQPIVIDAVWTNVEYFVDLQLSDPSHGKVHQLRLHRAIAET